MLLSALRDGLAWQQTAGLSCWDLLSLRFIAYHEHIERSLNVLIDFPGAVVFASLQLL
jgi:hypothetical protein